MDNEVQACENCGKGNLPSEKYCYACGHILPAGLQAVATAGLPDSELKPQLRWGTAYFGDHMFLRVHVQDANELIEKAFEKDCVLGRTVPEDGQGIDLSPYQAVDLGVSRQHAKLTRQSATIMVQDLGSTNGTFLNGQKLMPYQPRVLRNEDVLSLGRLELRVSFMRAPK